MTKTKELKPILGDDILYWVEDRCVCGKHAGCSARYTGYSTNGLRVRRVSARDVAEWPKDLPPLACEQCPEGGAR
jgi:hypothetical protein